MAYPLALVPVFELVVLGLLGVEDGEDGLDDLVHHGRRLLVALQLGVRLRVESRHVVTQLHQHQPDSTP